MVVGAIMDSDGEGGQDWAGDEGVLRSKKCYNDRFGVDH